MRPRRWWGMGKGTWWCHKQRARCRDTKRFLVPKGKAWMRLSETVETRRATPESLVRWRAPVWLFGPCLSSLDRSGLLGRVQTYKDQRVINVGCTRRRFQLLSWWHRVYSFGTVLFVIALPIRWRSENFSDFFQWQNINFSFKDGASYC